MYFQAARSSPELKAPLSVKSPHNEWIYNKSKNNKNETGSRYFRKWSILPNGGGVLQFKTPRRPRTTPKTQDLNLNKTRILQNLAPGPDLAARNDRAARAGRASKALPFWVRAGGPTFTRAVRALSTPGNLFFFSPQAVSGPKMQIKIKIKKKNFF